MTHGARSDSSFYLLPPLPLAQEQFTDMLNTDGVRIERIVSTGQSSPPGFWYDQPQHEWVMVVRGRASVTVQEATGNRTHMLESGDSLFLPAHQKHRVESTGKELQPCGWQCLLNPGGMNLSGPGRDLSGGHVLRRALEDHEVGSCRCP